MLSAGDTLQSKLGLGPEGQNKDLDSSNSGGAGSELQLHYSPKT